MDAMHLTSPSPEVVEKALIDLLAGISQANGLKYTTENASAPIVASLSDDDLLRNVQALDLAVNSLKLKADELKAAYHKRQNTTIRLHRLPPEVFAHILLSCLAKLASNTRRLHHLAQVCTHWRDVVLRTPALWAVVAYGGQMTDTVLKRAQDAPLTLVDNGPYYDCNKPGPLKEFLEKTGPPAERWKHLAWRGLSDPETLEAMGPHLAQELSIVQSMILGGRMYSEDAAQPLRVAGGAALRHLHLQSLTLDWTYLSLAGLKTISIEDATQTVDQQTEFLDALSSCKALETLLLKNCRTYGVDEYAEMASKLPIKVDEGTASTIHLPNLQKLSLSYIPDVIVARLLIRLRTPALGTFHLTASNVTRIFTSLQQSNKSYQLLSGTSAAFSITDRRVNLQGNCTKALVTLDLLVDELSSTTVAPFVGVFPDLPMTVHFRLREFESWINPEDLPLADSLLDAYIKEIPKLKVLKLGDIGDPLTLVSYLSRLPCPDLTELHFGVRYGERPLKTKLREALQALLVIPKFATLKVFDYCGKRFDDGQGLFVKGMVDRRVE